VQLNRKGGWEMGTGMEMGMVFRIGFRIIIIISRLAEHFAFAFRLMLYFIFAFAFAFSHPLSSLFSF